MVNRRTISESIEIAKKALERGNVLGLGKGAILEKADGTRMSVESMSSQQVEDELGQLIQEVRARPELLQKSDEDKFGNVARAAVDAINRGRAGIPDAKTLRQAELRRLRRLVRGR